MKGLYATFVVDPSEPLSAAAALAFVQKRTSAHPLLIAHPYPRKGPDRPKHHFDVLKETIPSRALNGKVASLTDCHLRNRDTTRNALFPCEQSAARASRRQRAGYREPAAVALARRSDEGGGGCGRGAVGTGSRRRRYCCRS